MTIYEGVIVVRDLLYIQAPPILERSNILYEKISKIYGTYASCYNGFSRLF